MPSVLTPASRRPLRTGIALFAVAALALALVEVGVLEYTYERIGIGPHVFGSLLLLSLLGSMINLPLGRIAAGSAPDLVPQEPWGAAAQGLRPPMPQGTVVAVNLGGAIVPTVLSLYLIALHGIWAQAFVAGALVAAVTHLLAKPVAGLGIAVPIFVPPFIAAAAALLLEPHSAPALAYAAGTLGTLIGADLANLSRIRDLGAPVVSIGGAGTFDGIFLTGVLAVLLA